MDVETLRLGPYQTNCYILHDSRSAWIIDPGSDGDRIVQRLETLGVEPKAVLLSHTHWDHTLGISHIFKHFREMQLMVHHSEAIFLGPDGGRLLRRFAVAIDPSQGSIPITEWESIPEPTRLLSDNDVIADAGLVVLHTPGHSPGSISFYQREYALLFSGDSLFAGTIGRTDLPNSQPELIINAIQKKLLTLPEETVVYPGHGPATTIGREKKNPWLL